MKIWVLQYVHYVVLSIFSFVSCDIDGGVWIVHLDPACTHDEFHHHMRNMQFSRNRKAQALHSYYNVIHGAAVRDIHEDELKVMPCVKHFVKDSIKRLVGVPSWGQDRVDQANLPLDDSFISYYSGQGVDVYILDTGIDTNHIEFTGGDFTREVKNIYSAFASKKKIYDPGSDIDGHGTVGGRTVGIAKGANIYGLKILGDNGEGSTADILAAMDVVHQRVTTSRRPSVLSMSLGGECEKPTDCSSDSLVMGVESLYRAGIVSSIASGNSGCNGCHGSPNAAPHAVNVGASGVTDFVTYFSNYGQCIDVFAPGFNIISAAAKSTSGNEHQYASMSGTSMACPHVAGVLALNLQKYNTGVPPSPDLVTKALLCDAARNVLHTDVLDTLSRNLLLQIPQLEVGGAENCDLGAGCESGCSGHGVCLSQRLTEHKPANDTMECYCDAGYYGSICDKNTQECKGSNAHHITLDLTDAFGDGWSFGSFSITDESGSTIDGAFDSLCDGYEDSRKYCLHDGKYTFRVESGMFPDENQWSMCGIEGGAPYVGQIDVNARHLHGCEFSCEDRQLTTLLMKDAYGDGWNGAYYNLFSPDRGALLYGGSLQDGKNGAHHVCLPVGCSVMMMGALGSEPSEVSYEICGFEGESDDVVNVCVDATTGACSVSLLDLDVDPGCDASVDHSGVDMMLFHFGVSDSFSDEPFAEGSIAVTITDPDVNGAVVSRTELANQFKGVYDICLQDGCYDVDIRTSSLEGNPVDAIWVICGVRGEAPWTARMCVSKEYNLCYGISNCPVILSYAHTSDLNRFLVYHDKIDDNGAMSNEVSHYGNVHGATDLCKLPVGHHSVYIGAGRYGGSDERRNEVHLCGHQLTIPVSADMQVIKNGTDCTLSNIHYPTCSGASQSHDMVLLDAYGDGWGATGKYTIREGSASGRVLHSGKLRYGQIHVDEICVESNKCYWLDVSAQEFEDEILWILCGYMGDAPSSMEFCTQEDNSCRFTSIDDDVYEREDDDDFIVIDNDLTTFPTALPTTTAPSRSPTLSPTLVKGAPTDRPTSSPVSPTAAPVISYPPSHIPSFDETHTPSALPTMEATNYTDRDTRPDFGVPIEKFVLYNSLEIRLKFSLLQGEVMDELPLNSTTLLFVIETIRKVVFNEGIETWNISISECSVSSLHVKPMSGTVDSTGGDSEGIFIPNPSFGTGELQCYLVLAVVPDPYAWLDLYALKSRLNVGLRTAVLTGRFESYLKFTCLMQREEFPHTSIMDDIVLMNARLLTGRSTLQAIYSSTSNRSETRYSKAFESFVTAGPEQTAHSTATLSEKEIEQTRAEVFAVTLVFTIAGLLIAYCVFLLYYCRVKQIKASEPVDIGGAYAKVHSNRTSHRKFEILDDDEEEDDDIEQYVAISPLSKAIPRKTDSSKDDDERSLDVGTGRKLAVPAPSQGSLEMESGSEQDSSSGRKREPRGAKAVPEISSLLTDALGAEDDMDSIDEQTY